MIDITKLYCETESESDILRYGEADLEGNSSFECYSEAGKRKPIVVWNITNSCNLKCLHCYSNSKNKIFEDELTTKEALKVIDNLAEYKIPALLFSGGEPLMRHDLFDLANYAQKKGLRAVLSTNGTLIDYQMARVIKDTGFSYVGISLDGIGDINDKFRGVSGAFNRTLKAFQYLKKFNQRVGLRMTLTKYNISDLNNIFDFIEKEDIDRACFYHLVYAGRGNKKVDINHQETRNAVDTILKRTKDFHNRGLNINVLTVDNHVDGVYVYLKLLQENPEIAERIYGKLEWNGGGNYSSGIGIAAIDYKGNVHPDQFWQHYSLGNVIERDFSEIWEDTSNPILKGLKNRKELLKGKCQNCKFIDICGGSLRVRADLLFKDPWMEDPACYLTNEEIARS